VRNTTAAWGGNNVGGASVHYWADTWRTPKDRLEKWEREFGLIGHTVSYTNADGTPLTGTVSAVDVAGGTPSLTVGDATDVDPSLVTSVR